MGRTAGSTASRECKICQQQDIHIKVVFRNQDGSPMALNYGSDIPVLLSRQPHDCTDFGLQLNPAQDAPFDAPKSWYHLGRKLSESQVAEIKQFGGLSTATEATFNTLKSININNESDPVTSPEPIVETSTTTAVAEPPADVAGAINVLFGNSLGNLENNLRALLAEGLIESRDFTVEQVDTAVNSLAREWNTKLDHKYSLQYGATSQLTNDLKSATEKIFMLRKESEGQTAINEGFLKSMVEINEKVQEVLDAHPIEHFTSIQINDQPVHKINGRTHHKLPELIKRVKRGSHIWLAGPAGSGKTTAAEQVAEALGRQCEVISCGPATDQYDIFGYMSPDGRYVPGLARKLFEEGGILMMDECDNTQPGVLVALNNALSGKSATFPDGTVKKHPDFVCIAGANTFGRGADRLYCGRNQIDAASLDRFGFMEFNYDEEAELEWAGSDQRPWIQYVQAIRHAAMERRLQVVISPRASIFGAIDLRDGDGWEETADCWIWAKMSDSDREMLQSVVQINDFRRTK